MQTLRSAARIFCRRRLAVIRKPDIAASGGLHRTRDFTVVVFFAVLVAPSFAQEQSQTPVQPESPSVNTTLPVNWLYGAYIPKDAPRVALNGKQRFKLYIRQTYTTPGIYIKTGFFTLHDQVKRYAVRHGGMGSLVSSKRVGSNQATNIIQNSFTSLGQGIVGWEPRYDRCKLRRSAGPRFRHAFHKKLRNLWPR